MAGTLLLTGANGSLGINVVKYLLSTYTSLTLILTVRDDSEKDINTVALRKVVSGYPDAIVSVRKLDLGSLKEVRAFSANLQSEIMEAKVPKIDAIMCQAMVWKLSGGPAFTEESFESSMAINHLAQFEMVLRLLEVMNAQRGRIVFFGSEAHWPERAGLSKGFPTKLPEDLESLVHPPQDSAGKELGEGFRRYGLSKLVVTMVAYELNRRLAENKDTKFIRAVTIDPGNMINSTTFSRDHIPVSVRMMFTVAAWLAPLLRLFGLRLITVEQGAKPVVDVAIADEFAGLEGYLESGVKVNSSPDSLDESMQKRLWQQSVAWCGLKSADTVIKVG